MMHSHKNQFDVAIVGGGLIGSMASLMLQRRGLRTVVLESRPAGKPQKVVIGEAITEGTSVFLRHELGLEGWLQANVFRKFGFDFLTLPRTGPTPRTLDECHELLLSLTPLEKLPGALMRLIPTYHVERPKLDAHVADEARTAGADWRHGASVEKVDLGPMGQVVRYGTADGTPGEVTARWVLDASGRRTLLGRQLGITRTVEGYDTASTWNRFENVASDKSVWRTFHGVDRRRHTIHMTGQGFWIWWIHQSPQMTSVGISWDRTQHSPDVKTDDRGFWEMVSKFPPILPLLEGARPMEPFQHYAHLAYNSDHWVGRDGYALLGDAAWFTDALYSTGIETACRQMSNVVPLIEASCRGGDVCAKTVMRLNDELRNTQASVLKINQFKYREGWQRPHVVAQTAVYELGDITELYHLQRKQDWTPERRARWYHLPWYSDERRMRLNKFLDDSAHDPDRDLEPGAPLVKKALLPGPLVYLSTWPLWKNPRWTPIFFRIIRLWSYSERMTQRTRWWPDALGWMASSRDLRALAEGKLVGRAAPRPAERIAAVR